MSPRLSLTPTIRVAGLVAALLIGLIITPNPATAETIGFNDDVRPILSKHCIACHGPDEGDRQAGLRLDTEEGAHEWAIIPGDPENSDLIDRVVTDDKELRMPPPEHGESLSESEIAVLRQWIDQGARYETHWSFTPPRKKPLIPINESIEAPVLKRHPEWAAASSRPIDAWVAARWQEKGLTPSPRETPHRLARRVSLALTGLPPAGHSGSVANVIDRFAVDPSDAHYDAMVDALLASPAYGEHWAALWLDLARYADTIGYAGDEDRSIWPWRDWVIRSINANQPFDQFTIEQLAGDLLPGATDEQRLATAFHRNTLNNNEGGTDNEEFRMIAVKDRINTTMNVWMGLTMRCAECHSHKYDPISQTEYYQFLDFFNQTADNDERDERPRLDLFPIGRDTQFAQLNTKIKALKKKSTESNVWTTLRPTNAESRDGSKFEILDDHSVLATGPNPEFDEYRLRFELPAGKHSGLRLEVLPDERHGGNTGRASEGGFIITQVRAELASEEDEVQKLKFRDVQADHEHVNLKAQYIIREQADNKGWSANHPEDGNRAKRQVILTFDKPVNLDSPAELKFAILHQPEWKYLNTGRVRLSATPIEDAAKKYRKKTLDPIGRQIADLEKQLRSPVRVPVMQDRDEDQRRMTFVNLRGNFKSHGDRVDAAVPQAFHPLPSDSPRDRLAVARWLMAPENPLTARVTVNRYWARLFGIGIVETEEDFGTQGMPPSHPELLDHLAVDFMESGWDVKALLKRIVMSSTYRQSHRVTEEPRRSDPRNRWLARGPRFRLTAEEVRDQTLAATGLLSPKQFGPPVYPTSPIKKMTNAFKGDVLWKASEGEDRYRRALYTYLKRSQPHPMFGTFDMETREVCSLRRFRTNTPLQSLMNLNSETAMDAARALARAAVASCAENEPATETIDARRCIEQCLERALYEPPGQPQVRTLMALYETALEDFEARPEDAAAITGSDPSEESRLAPLAAMTVVANVVLNLDAFVTN